MRDKNETQQGFGWRKFGSMFAEWDVFLKIDGGYRTRPKVGGLLSRGWSLRPQTIRVGRGWMRARSAPFSTMRVRVAFRST